GLAVARKRSPNAAHRHQHHLVVRNSTIYKTLKVQRLFYFLVAGHLHRLVIHLIAHGDNAVLTQSRALRVSAFALHRLGGLWSCASVEEHSERDDKRSSPVFNIRASRNLSNHVT